MHVYNPFNVRQFLVIYVSEMLICPRMSLCSADLKQPNVFHLEKSSWFCCPEVYIGVVPLICGGRNILPLFQPTSAVHWLEAQSAGHVGLQKSAEHFVIQVEISPRDREASHCTTLIYSDLFWLKNLYVSTYSWITNISIQLISDQWHVKLQNHLTEQIPAKVHNSAQGSYQVLLTTQV